MRLVDPDDPEAASKLMTPLTPKDRVRYALKQVDSDGYWAVISSAIVFGTFLLESYNMSSFGGSVRAPTHPQQQSREPCLQTSHTRIRDPTPNTLVL